jgi:hypothetical protein
MDIGRAENPAESNPFPAAMPVKKAESAILRTDFATAKSG